MISITLFTHLRVQDRTHYFFNRAIYRVDKCDKSDKSVLIGLNTVSFDIEVCNIAHLVFHHFVAVVQMVIQYSSCCTDHFSMKIPKNTDFPLIFKPICDISSHFSLFS